MIRLDSSGWLLSSRLKQYPNIIHGFSTRAMKDARIDHVRHGLMKSFDLPLVRGDQVHEAHVEIVRDDQTALYKSTDALVTHRGSLAVGVITADCVPILLADPVHHIVGVVHSGWRGLLKGIIEATIDTMVEEGGDLGGMLACIGPHIGACCYQVQEERVRMFEDRFHDETIAGENGLGWFIDIGQASRQVLVKKGLKKDAIDTSVFCTSCQNELFYSYRKDSKETFGELLSFIALT